MKNTEINMFDLQSENTVDSFIDETEFFELHKMNININFTLSSIYNPMFMISNEKFAKIQEHNHNSSDYLTALMKDQERTSKVLTGKTVRQKEDLIAKNNLLSFEKPIYELFFKIYLYNDLINILPHCLSDIVFSSSFKIDRMLNFTFNNLSLDSFLYVEVYSTELAEIDSLVGSTVVPLFDENRNLVQGRNIYKVRPDKHLNNSEKDELNGVQKDDIYRELTLLIKKTDFNQSNRYNLLYSGTLEYDKQLSKLNNLLAKSKDAYLEIEFPSFKCPVVYFDKRNEKHSDIYFAKNQKFSKKWIIDPEMRKSKNIYSKDNPISEKFSILSRTDFDTFSKDIKPTPAEDKRIAEIINSNDFQKLDDNDIVLFWKYRYHLINRHGCLTKVISSINWGDEKSEREVFDNIMANWDDVELGEILFLLSFKFCLNPIYLKKEDICNSMAEIRKFAVDALTKYKNEDIHFVLLQLVQALRYESLDSENQYLANFLIKKCSSDIYLASSFYWFLKVETDTSVIINKETDMKMAEIYKKIFNQLVSSLSEEFAHQIESQNKLRNELVNISKAIKKVNGANEKNEKLVSIIQDKSINSLCYLDEPLQIPFYPDIKIESVVPNRCRVFKSAKYPIKFTFKVTNESQQYNKNSPDPAYFEVFFKLDDDLRQDQLVLQMFSFMDNLLNRVKMDFEFTDYKVLSTSKSDGFVEFVGNSTTLYDIYTNQNARVPDWLATQGLVSVKDGLASFINSAAAYAVATYILMIGDRHLENIMITKHGRMFHIDFGFILGRDPKPWPAEIRITKEMVEDMGGFQSETFQNFAKKSVDAYFYLRQNAKLTINMVYLMIHSGIDLSLNYEEVLNKLNDKFNLNLSDQEAKEELLTTINNSASSFYYWSLDKWHIMANIFK